MLHYREGISELLIIISANLIIKPHKLGNSETISYMYKHDIYNDESCSVQNWHFCLKCYNHTKKYVMLI